MHVDESVGGIILLRFNQAYENYFEVSIGKDSYSLTNNKLSITDITEIFHPNIGSDLLQQRVVKCIDWNRSGKTQYFVNSTLTNCPTPNRGASSLPPIGDSFMYRKYSTLSNGQDAYLWVRRERIIAGFQL